MSAGDSVVVYRGFDPAGLDLVESMLRAEGLQPRRLGRAQPALLGVGNAAVEQLIAVPPEHEEAARALISASQHAGAAELASLEAQALEARLPAEDRSADAPDTLGVLRLALLAALAALAFFALRYATG